MHPMDIPMALLIESLETPPADQWEMEIVERKGTGHPDTICDCVAEEFSLALCRFYQEHFGLILHHNVDKVLLRGGSASPRFGGGRVTEPIEIYLAGRATSEFKGVRVPVAELAEESCRQWLRAALPALDPDKHVRVHSLIRAGSAELVELFLRQREKGVVLANDTSCGVGYAPLSELERLVYSVEQQLNLPSVKEVQPELGGDIKVMGVREGQQIHLTIACALVDAYVADLKDYLVKKARIADMVQKTVRNFTPRQVTVAVNTADDPDAASIYLTVTGTSAEAGDDGEAGRGNRANGLITPCRPMTMEAVAGKNPVTHVGKLYNLAANLISLAIVREIPEVKEALCYLVSQIGRPIGEPQLADVKVRMEPGYTLEPFRPRLQEIVSHHLGRVGALAQELLDGTLTSSWPFRHTPATDQEGERLRERQEMVRQIEAETRDTVRWTGRYSLSPPVIKALSRVPRHAFVPLEQYGAAYLNGPLPIGYGQTISQPYIVALMTDLAAVNERSVVLEVGTGSGYQAAVLAELVQQLFTIELVPELAEQAKRRLQRLGYANVEVRTGDGYAGWPEHAPFDAIVVTAAATEIPPPLVTQLKAGGRLVIPVHRGPYGQELVLLVKDAGGQVQEKDILPVAFVPLRHPI
jgi:S-adenosylmethionine synthetase